MTSLITWLRQRHPGAAEKPLRDEFDDAVIDAAAIPLVDDGGTYHVRVVLGK